MKIEVWSDFVCPFCYIGKRRLEAALNKFEDKDEVEVIFKSFELDTSAKKKYEENIHELIAKKYGISLEQAKASNDQLVSQAKEVGLDFNFDDLIPTNTFDAHRVSQYAKAEGKMNELSERILRAYFVDSLNISDHKVLATLAEEVGIDREKALDVLVSGKHGEEVRTDEETASRFGVTGVPFFVINEKYAVSGAQPSELFLEVLQKVKAEEFSSQESSASQEDKEEDLNSGICTDGKCEI